MTDPRPIAGPPLPTLERLRTWREASTSGDAIAAALEAGRAADPETGRLIARAERVVFTGAGSSYHLAQVAAVVARERTGRPAIATPLSELLLRPGGVLGPDEPVRQVVVVVSRSGSTSEAVEVLDRVRRAGHPSVVVTCRSTSPLAAAAQRLLVSPTGNETAIVMTRSFASMLALLLRVIAGAAGDRGLAADLDRMPDRWPEAVAAAELGQHLGGSDPARVVVLGGGPVRAIAEEWRLKLIQTSRLAADAYEPLEFRHGPISVCEAGVLVVGLIGGPGAAEESRVLREAAGLGAETWLIGREADDDRGLAGWISLVGSGLHPWARLPLLVYPAQALALTLALARGCDPDAPRHLGQVVILDPA